MKIPRICTVVTGKSLDEFLGNLEKIQEVSDFVELRVDHIREFSLDDLEIIKEHTYRDAIFCCRMKGEGGLYEGSEAEKKVIIEKAGGIGFTYVDIEISSVQKFDLSKFSETQVILSFHDFDGTPALERLRDIKGEMKKFPVVIMKFATLVRGEEDARVLWRFLLEKEEGERMIVSGMGEQGKVVRVLGPFLGSELTFSRTEYGESAGGQVDAGRLKDVYEELDLILGTS